MGVILRQSSNVSAKMTPNVAEVWPKFDVAKPSQIFGRIFQPKFSINQTLPNLYHTQLIYCIIGVVLMSMPSVYDAANTGQV